MSDYTAYQSRYTGKEIDSAVEKSASSEIYTSDEKNKLSALKNYDDTSIKSDISAVKTQNNHETFGYPDTVLKAGDDLDALDHFGVYVCPNNTTSTQIANIPVYGSGVGGFRLEMKNRTASANNTTYAMQIMYSNWNAGKIFMRFCNNGNWGNWFVFDGTEITQ